MDKFVPIAKTIRVAQWVKNIVVFAPIIFSGFLFVPGYFGKVVWAFVLFCLLSSSIYIFNDLIDIKSDEQHPFKKKTNRKWSSTYRAGSISFHATFWNLFVAGTCNIDIFLWSDGYLLYYEYFLLTMVEESANTGCIYYCGRICNTNLCRKFYHKCPHGCMVFADCSFCFFVFGCGEKT